MLKKINLIKIKNRIRKDIGDLTSLKTSIEEIGLINPIVIDKDNNLIAGERRLLACKELGLKEIECKTFNFNQAEIDENECRKDFTVEERLNIAEWFENEEKIKAKERKLSTLKQSTDSQNFGQRGKTDNIVAQKTGFGSGETYRQAKKVFNDAPQDIKDKVNTGEMKISRAFNIITKKPSDSPDWLKLFNIWYFQERDKTLGQEHPGNIPGQIAENVLHYFTSKNDLVIDPFGGGGSTIDVCKKHERQCFAYDIKPMRKDIKQHDITSGFPEEAKNCDLIFLDPPYWSQKKKDYADNSISNLSLSDFSKSMDKLAQDCHKTVKSDGYVSLIIGATQVDGKFIDHAFDCYKIFEKYFTLKMRINVPYSTQQYQAYSVKRAKDNKQMLNLYRDLIVWQKR